jgi:hypothetical protein
MEYIYKGNRESVVVIVTSFVLEDRESIVVVVTGFVPDDRKRGHYSD